MLSFNMSQFMPDYKIEFSPVKKLAIVIGYSDALRETIGIGQMPSSSRNNIPLFKGVRMSLAMANARL
jgi:hypothetical protein